MLKICVDNSQFERQSFLIYTSSVTTSIQAIGLFPLPDSDSDSDSKPNGYIVLYRSFSSAQTRIPIQIPFLNGYCTHFRDGSLSQGQISIPITYISIRGSESESEPVEKFCIVQESISESGSESDSGSGNKP